MSDKKSFLELKQEELHHALERDRIAHEISFYEDRKHDTATLTERLAQAERERDIYKSQRDASCKHAESLECERDEAWRYVQGRIDVIEALSAERDAALARLENGEGYLHLTRERDAALAKAEAAEKKHLQVREWHEEEAAAHADLRARIEALADDADTAWGDAIGGITQRLRTLLQRPKPETALDVIAELESIWFKAVGDQDGGLFDKLRKLLEQK